MSDFILSPETTPIAKANIAGPLSQNEITLKKVIDVKSLLPGDLVLCSAVAPDFIQRNIRLVQARGGYAQEHARWEHAAVYIGNGVLCEATRHGVQREMLSSYVGSHHIRFRRDLKLTSDERYEVAIAALSLQAHSYNLLEIFRLIKVARLGFNNHAKATIRTSGFPKRAMICSELYADSYAKATRRIVGNIAGGEVTPASLSADPGLTDVQAYWLSIG